MFTGYWEKELPLGKFETVFVREKSSLLVSCTEIQFQFQSFCQLC